MSSIDIEALRKAAEAALHTGEWYNAGCGTVHDGEHDEVAHPCDSSAVAHIVAAQPRAIIALLDALAAEKRKTLELSRVYEERGRQIERLELRNSRAEAAAGAVPEGAITGEEVTALARALIREKLDDEDDDFHNARAHGIGSLNADILTFTKNRAAPPAQGLPAAPDDVLDAKRHRYTRATTTAIRDPETGERIEITPEMYDAAIDRAMARDPDAKLGIKAKDMPAAAPSEPVAWMRPAAMEPEFTSDAVVAGYWMRKGSTVTPLAPFATPPAQDAGTGDATIVAIGYESGFMATDPDHDGATVKLHYRDEATAEAAFCAITRIIDRAIANSGRTE